MTVPHKIRTRMSGAALGLHIGPIMCAQILLTVTGVLYAGHDRFLSFFSQDRLLLQLSCFHSSIENIVSRLHSFDSNRKKVISSPTHT